MNDTAKIIYLLLAIVGVVVLATVGFAIYIIVANGESGLMYTLPSPVKPIVSIIAASLVIALYVNKK